MLLYLLPLAVPLAPRSAEAFQPSRPQRVRVAGRVVDSSGAPVAGATVTITSARGGTSTTTPASGRFAVTAGDTGAVKIDVRAVGLRRVSFSARSGDSAITVRMRPLFTSLGSVHVRAPRRLPPPRAAPTIREVATFEQLIGFGAVPVDLQGDVVAAATAVPGVRPAQQSSDDQVAPPAFSALGLPPDRNVVTLDGLRFLGMGLPRDAAVVSRLTVLSPDVTSGGYSGAALELRAAPGAPVPARTLHLTADAPFLQRTDALGREQGLPVRGATLSGGASGSFDAERGLYTSAVQVSHYVNDAPSPLSPRGAALASVGVPSEVLGPISESLAQLGVPTAGVSNVRERTTASAFSRVDLGRGGPRSGGVLAYGELLDADGLGLQPYDLATRASALTRRAVGTQLFGTWYSAQNVLVDARVGVARAAARLRPATALPDARVLLSDANAPTYGDVAELRFGGSAAGDRSVTNDVAELLSTAQWRDRRARQTYTLFVSATDDRTHDVGRVGLNGTVVYPSAAALAANRPILVSRILSSARANPGVLTAATGVGDEWAARDDLTLRYGLRVEYGHVVDRPGRDSIVDVAFTPRAAGGPVPVVLPRFGLEWRAGTATAPVGPFPRTPRTTVRFGFGAFRDVLPSTALAGFYQASGASAVPSLVCFGADAPSPDWGDRSPGGATLPASCARTSASAGDAGAPPITAQYTDARLSSDFRNSVSWRGAVSASHVVRPWLRFGGEVLAARNVHDASVTDLNLREAPLGRLDAEGGRPVYFAPSEVDPASGILSPTAGRRNVGFGPVLLEQSDASSAVGQATATVALTPNPWTTASLYYVGRRSRVRARGLDGSTGGDPSRFEVGPREGDSPYEVGATLLHVWQRKVFFTLYGRLFSGNRYSPLVGSDVNGDGRANDRAFVFDPATTPDSATAAGMRRLLSTANARVRACLQPQLGRIAGRASCAGPWTPNITSQVTFNSAALGLPRRATVTLGIANLLGGVDQVLHGSALRGWGGTPAPDPILLQVRGYDPARGRYLYDVNPRFGSASVRTAQGLNPFRVTVEVRVAVGPGPDVVGSRALLRAPSGGPGRVDPGVVYGRLAGAVFDPAAMIAGGGEALGLQPDQRARLDSASQAYHDEVDAINVRFRKYVESAPNAPPDSMAAEYQRVRDDTYTALVREGIRVHAILTAAQRERLPLPLAAAVDPAGIATFRPTRSPGFGEAIFH